MMMNPNNSALVKSTLESQNMSFATICRMSCKKQTPSIGQGSKRSSRSSVRLSQETLSVMAMLAYSSPQESSALPVRSSSGSILRRSSSPSVRRHLSFGENETLEFDKNLPSYYCTAERTAASRWRPSGLDRSMSMPRIPSRALD